MDVLIYILYSEISNYLDTPNRSYYQNCITIKKKTGLLQVTAVQSCCNVASWHLSNA